MSLYIPDYQTYDRVDILERDVGIYRISMVVPGGSELDLDVDIHWSGDGTTIHLATRFEARMDLETGSVEIVEAGDERWGSDMDDVRDANATETRTCREDVGLDRMVAVELRGKILEAFVTRQSLKLRNAIRIFEEYRTELTDIGARLENSRADLEARVRKVVDGGRKQGVTGEPEEKIQTTIGTLRIAAAESEGRYLYVTGPGEKAARDKGLSFYSELERSLVKEDGSAVDPDKDYLRFQGNLGESKGRAYIAMAIDEYLARRPTAFDEVAAIEARMAIADANGQRDDILHRFGQAEAKLRTTLSLYEALDRAAQEEVAGYMPAGIEVPEGYAMESPQATHRM